MLKGGASDIQRQVQAFGGILDETDHLGGELLEGLVAADEARARKLAFQIAQKSLRIVAEQDGRDALVAGRDQDWSERAFADGEAHLPASTAGPKVRRSHAQHLRRIGIEAAIGVEACVVDRLGYRPAFAELRPHSLGAMGCSIGLRRHAERLLEDAMEMVRAQADQLGERIQLRLLVRVLDQAAGLRDLLGMQLVERWLGGPAALAGPEARPLGISASVVKA